MQTLAGIIFEILFLIVVLIILIIIASIFIIRDLKIELNKVQKIRARFHVEIRKIVNLIYNVHSPAYLEPFTKVVIKIFLMKRRRFYLKI